MPLKISINIRVTAVNIMHSNLLSRSVTREATLSCVYLNQWLAKRSQILLISQIIQ